MPGAQAPNFRALLSDAGFASAPGDPSPVVYYNRRFKASFANPRSLLYSDILEGRRGHRIMLVQNHCCVGTYSGTSGTTTVSDTSRVETTADGRHLEYQAIKWRQNLRQ